MQAYNKSTLYNKYVQEQSLSAFEKGCISEESYRNISRIHSFKLYTPNYFIRIALGLLTFVAILCSGLLLWLLSETLSAGGLTTLFIFLALFCYIALELFVSTKQYYNAGVDNTLMISVIIFTACAVFASDFESSYLFFTAIVLVVVLWLTLRFADAFMAALSYCALFVFIFLLYIRAGEMAKVTAPFTMMAFSALTYITMNKFLNGQNITYRLCFQTISMVSMATFYASGNYFVVKELGSELFGASKNQPLPFGWFFWICTVVIPLAYIAYGILRKNLLFIRCGLGLIAVTVFTLKFYYAVLSAEMVMLIAGILLVGISYALIRFLKTPRYGFSSDHSYSHKQLINAEALIIAQTFGQTKIVPDTNSLFGGGSGGGGGATGNY